jgi:putative tryptophan/tyrosine transport system substrate-binding protein
MQRQPRNGEANVTRRTKNLAAIVTLALVLLTELAVAEAQSLAKTPRIAYLSSNIAPSAPILEAFRQGLRELGWIDGQNITIEWRSTAGQDDLLPGLAAELVRLKVDVIIAGGVPATWAAKQATTTIPIVMVGGGPDPIATGLVVSLARPGGNLTGLATAPPEIFSEKQLELLKEALPGVSRVAVLWDPAAITRDLVRGMEEAARSLGVQLQLLEVRGPGDIEPVFTAAIRQHSEALVIVGSSLLTLHRAQIAALALNSRLPAIGLLREFAEAGGLMAYGPNLSGLARRAATYVDKILRGAKPDDLPVEQPMWFALIINLKTAQTLGLTVPPALLFQATEVIR